MCPVHAFCASIIHAENEVTKEAKLMSPSTAGNRDLYLVIKKWHYGTR
jgi:hypothetical protein